MRIHILHENEAWLPPFAAALDAEGLPWEAWHLDGGVVDLDAPPPQGVFWSRMSASSHTRGHRDAKEHTRSVLSWLEGHGRRVVNGRRILELEVSKVDQHAALRAAGLDVPRTFAVVGDPGRAAEVARRLPAPFITKHNQGGKGLGVQRFDSHDAFDRALAQGLALGDDAPVDGTLLLQEYLEPAEPRITRIETVGGEFVYALTARTSGGFELCPAEACVVGEDGTPLVDEPTFQLREDLTAADAAPWLAFARAWGLGVGGFEFIETADGRRVTYDINTNTNYNPDVERSARLPAATAVARYLGRLLAEEAAARPAADADHSAVATAVSPARS
jgi:hypothetical protein